MTRTDNDTWDLATSVGATATGVAVGRALANRASTPLINDPFAEPLVRAVGVDFFTRLASGELDPADVDDNAEFGMKRMGDMMAVRTRYFDDFFTIANTVAAAIGSPTASSKVVMRFIFVPLDWLLDNRQANTLSIGSKSHTGKLFRMYVGTFKAARIVRRH